MAEAGRRFSFKRCLGAGGFGQVYLATMTSASGVSSEVAVKVLHQGLDPKSQAIQRLRDEGRMLGSLNHPGVLKVHDLLMLEGRMALVMEYVPGLDVEQCVELPTPLPTRAALEALALVADALRVAYEMPGPDGLPLQLVHRDLKPPNIRIGQHGSVKVLDFGIAKAADTRREAKTQAAVVMGSPWYMAPERFMGINDHPASDVYSLGCSFYEVFAKGERLFSSLSTQEHFLLAMNPDAHAAHLDKHLPRMQVPEGVRVLVERMLCHQPSQRPTAGQLSERAEALVESVPGTRLRAWCKDVDWPEAPNDEGDLTGRVVTEEGVSFLGTAPNVAALLGAAPAMEPLSTLYEDDESETDPVEPPPITREVAIARRRERIRVAQKNIPILNKLVVPGLLGSVGVVTLGAAGAGLMFLVLLLAVCAGG